MLVLKCTTFNKVYMDLSLISEYPYLSFLVFKLRTGNEAVKGACCVIYLSY